MVKINQIKTKAIAFFCSFLILISGFASTTIVMADTNGNSPSIVCIDTPTSNYKLSDNKLNVSGWSLDKSGVKGVQVSVDNGAAQNATIGQLRTDVDKFYPGYTGGKNSGYSANLDVSSLSTGAHTVKVTSTGNDGVVTSQNVVIYKVPSGSKNMPQHVDIDTPSNGFNISTTGTLDVTGWSLNGYGVQKVQVYVDNGNETDATIGLSRPDVDKVFPGYATGKSSGYTASVTLPTVSDGIHTIKVVSIGNDGSQAVATVNIKKVSEQSMPGRVCIDTLQNNSKVSSNEVNVAGWSLNVTGVKGVQISVDNGTAQNATIGQLRTDVDKFYPGYTGGKNSGYSANLDVSSLSTGAHTVKVTSTGNDGVVTSQNVVIYKVPSGSKNMPQHVDIDTPSNGFNLATTGTLDVTGWSLNGYGVQKVQVYVDNGNETDATIGLSRPDVDKVFPGYATGKSSGYTASVTLPTLSDGIHTIKVVSIGNDGSQAIDTVNIKKVSEQSMPGRICIDTPQNNSKISSNELSITGWSLNVTGVKGVQISVDNGTAQNATIGQSRADVDRFYPGYTGGKNSGYSANLDVSSLSTGAHTVKVTSTGNDGVVTSQNVVIYKVPSGSKNMPQHVDIDTPSNGFNLATTGTLDVTGWSLNGFGVQKVQVYVDNANETDATIGLSRPDVDKVFPGYATGKSSGYTASVTLPTLSDGIHTIKVVSIGNDGSQAVATVNIKKVSEANMPGIVCIDSPSYSQTKDKQIDVRGWALDINGVTRVQVSIDNGAMQDATIGQSRPDIPKVYQGYNNEANSGYSTKVDISKLSIGVHTITVVSTGKDGTTAKNTTQIYVLPQTASDLSSMVCIDTPGNDAFIKAQDNLVNVIGWSLNAFGVQKVQVYVDNIYNGDATTGITRTDVDKVYPGYVGGVNSGYNYTINISSFSYGAHQISVRSLGNDGKVTNQDIVIYKVYNDTNIASKLVSFLSFQDNLNMAEGQAVQLHNGDFHNNCVYFSSSVLRDIGINVPISMANTEHYVPFITSLGWTKDYDINNLYPGNICFTVSDGTGYPTHTFIFMGWVNPFDHTLAYVADNQDNKIHVRSMIDAPGIDATSFEFHN